MGHRDLFSLPPVDRASASAEPPAPAVHVWGDTSHFDFHAVAGEASRTDAAPLPSGEAPGELPDSAGLYQRIGHLTRTLHDALRELGYHDSLADARDHLPDARDRLAYIARVTGDAAEKVLNSVDQARAVQDALSTQAQGLHARWEALAPNATTGQRAKPAGKKLREETRAFLEQISERTARTNTILTEIMMAQDFHDLTGQVICKVVSLSQELEEHLVKLLIDATPVEQRRKIECAKLEGPVVDPEIRPDVVSDQAGVDDLLASLGF